MQFDIFDFEWCFNCSIHFETSSGKFAACGNKRYGSLQQKSLPEAKATANLLKLQMVSFATHSLQTCVGLSICVNMSILVVGCDRCDPLTLFVS
jgi:hypothetical protein